MRVDKLSVASALVALGSMQAVAGPERDAHLRVLVFYSEHTESDHVDFARQANQFFGAEAVREHVDWDMTTNWDDLNTEKLKN